MRLSEVTGRLAIEATYFVEAPPPGEFIALCVGQNANSPRARFEHPNIAHREDVAHDFKYYRRGGRKEWVEKKGVNFWFVVPRSCIELLAEKGYSYVPASIHAPDGKSVKVRFNVSGGTFPKGCWTDQLRTAMSISVGHPIRDMRIIAAAAVRGTALEAAMKQPGPYDDQCSKKYITHNRANDAQTVSEDAPIYSEDPDPLAGASEASIEPGGDATEHAHHWVEMFGEATWTGFGCLCGMVREVDHVDGSEEIRPTADLVALREDIALAEAASSKKEPETWDACENCGWSNGDTKEPPHELADLFERVEADGIFPTGECPRCDSLTYLQPSRWVEAKDYNTVKNGADAIVNVLSVLLDSGADRLIERIDKVVSHYRETTRELPVTTCKEQGPGYLTDIFGPVISEYSRAQAIEDGVLVDMSAWGEQGGADGMLVGFRPGLSVVFTRHLFEVCDAVPKKAWGNSLRGRAHDVLFLAYVELRAQATAMSNLVIANKLAEADRYDPSNVRFTVLMHIREGRRRLALRACSNSEGVTIGFPEDF